MSRGDLLYHWAEKIVFLTVILAILLSALQFSLHAKRYKRLINESTYQVVTLTNGQTFFGKLERFGPSTYALIDVYYIQTELTPAEETTTETGELTAETSDNLQERTTLVPLTSDPHQPYNHIVLNRDHMVSWQNLQPTSPILEAIQELRQ